MIKGYEQFLNERHFEDLTQYVYDGYYYPDCVNIGWLEKGHPFEKGEVPDGFIEKLKHLPIMARYCGPHYCDFCDLSKKSNLNGGEYSSRTMMAIGKDDIIYVMPDMIAHYVEKHNYKPPQEFIDAVMNMNMTEKEAIHILNDKMRKQKGDLPFSEYMNKISVKNEGIRWYKGGKLSDEEKFEDIEDEEEFKIGDKIISVGKAYYWNDGGDGKKPLYTGENKELWSNIESGIFNGRKEVKVIKELDYCDNVYGYTGTIIKFHSPTWPWFQSKNLKKLQD